MLKILLVEDNEMNRDMLSRRLKRRGYQVVIAVNGSEGVSMSISEHPDLVLMYLTALSIWSQANMAITGRLRPTSLVFSNSSSSQLSVSEMVVSRTRRS